MNAIRLTDPEAPASPTVFSGRAPEAALTFRLDDQEYGIVLSCVQEIRSYQAPTRLAGASDDLLGIIDLRGEIVPLVDLRRRFGMRSAEADGFTVIVVVSLGDRRVGVVADQVNDVVSLSPDQIRPMPRLKEGADQAHLVGIGRVEQRTLVLLDIESLLRGVQLGPAAAAG